MGGAADDHPLLLTTLPPSDGQRRLAFAIIAAFTVVFAVTVPFAHAPLPRLNAWIPSAATALVINDLITAALLFSQFSIARQRALLVLATSYLFSGLIVIPYALTFPGIFAPTGLLGAGLQSAVWLYVIWHVASPLSVIIYGLLKSASDGTNAVRSVERDIGLSIAIVIAAVGAIIWFVTAQHDLLPEIYRDRSRLGPTAQLAAGVIFLACAIALALLWLRRKSVLDLWLMVTVYAWLLEITLNGLFLTDRFSLAWYMGRIYALIASGVVLIVLLSEITTLYAQLARSVIRQRAARHARQVAMDTMAASIAHEVSQPLGTIAANAEAALMLLAKTPPDNHQVRAALEDIAAANARANEVITSLRAMFKKDAHGRARVDINDLVREVLAILEFDFRAQGVFVATQLRAELPQILGDRGQLRQVFLNLMTNAIEAMRLAPDHARELRITSNVTNEASTLVVAFGDSGPGIDWEDQDRIFEPFFTTKSAGTGIGLTICRSIIDAHGGSLRVSANKPHGTIFEVVVPVDA